MKKSDDAPSSQKAMILDATRIIVTGGLVVFPTETVYGLGADALDADAVRSVFAAKGRPPDNPLIVHLADLADLDRVAAHAPAVARELFARFAPGPLTLVMPAHRDLAPAVTAGLSTVAVRFPAHPVAIELLRACGRPLAAPSANRSGEPSPTTVEMARASLGDAVGVYLDGGPCRVGLESTVAAVSDGIVTILRPGAVTAGEIGEAFPGVRVEYAAKGALESESAPSPGLRHRHYQPHAEVLTVEANKIEAARLTDVSGPVGVMGLHGDVRVLVSLLERRGNRQADARRDADARSNATAGKAAPGLAVRESADPAGYARSLYRWFSEFDEIGVRSIVAVLPPAEGIGRAIRDRLDRASGGNRLE